MPLTLSGELDDDDVTGAWQGAVPDEKVSAADGGDHASRNKKSFSADDATLSTCEMETTRFFAREARFSLKYNCARASLAKPAQSI